MHAPAAASAKSRVISIAWQNLDAVLQETVSTVSHDEAAPKAAAPSLVTNENPAGE